jgi:hypothetical protein
VPQIPLFVSTATGWGDGIAFPASSPQKIKGPDLYLTLLFFAGKI